MKKLCVIFVFIFMLLTACSVNTKDKDSQTYKLITALDGYSDSTVLFYTNEKLYFYKIHTQNKAENAAFELYEYDFAAEKVTVIGKIEDFFMSTNSVVPLEDGFAFTVCTQNTEKFTHNLYYYYDNTLQNLCSWESNIPMSYVEKVSEQELVLFYPYSIKKDTEESYVYKIEKVRLDTKIREEILSFSYSITQKEGEIVPDVDVKNDLIYVFKKKIDDAYAKYYICSFDRDGNEVETYAVDMDEFLYLELTALYDSVDRLECIEENLFVLQTLNSRIIIFEKIGDELIRVDIPERLYAYPEGYKIVQGYYEENEEILFVNMFNDNLIKFHISSKEFLEKSIMKNTEESNVKSLISNENGDVLLRMDGHFYLCQDKSYQFLKAYSVLD